VLVSSVSTGISHEIEPHICVYIACILPTPFTLQSSQTSPNLSPFLVDSYEPGRLLNRLGILQQYSSEQVVSVRT
jgi:hypothetical protein